MNAPSASPPAPGPATGRRPRILSGMRPTGRLHLGHYLGALANWVKLQADYDCFYMVADWHALMSEYKDPSALRANGLDNVIDWLGAGVDPDRSVIFLQSDIPEHLELYMILACVTPIAWLERCPTYKEQIQALAQKEVNNYAFLGYPALQAADILLYKGNAVPVGEDQIPHLELTREIVRRFNGLYGGIFPEPAAKLTETPRLPGLDGRKMSKSYGNTIDLSDDPATVRKKVLGMTTDVKRPRRADPGHPEECYAYAYHQFATDPARLEPIAVECRAARLGCVDCKKDLADSMARWLGPIQARRAEFAAHPEKARQILGDGTSKARRIAQETMKEVREAVFGNKFQVPGSKFQV